MVGEGPGALVPLSSCSWFILEDSSVLKESFKNVNNGLKFSPTHFSSSWSRSSIISPFPLFHSELHLVIYI